jgi:hypothetical protein
MLHHKISHAGERTLRGEEKRKIEVLGAKFALLSHRSSTLSWNKVYVFMVHDVDTQLK